MSFFQDDALASILDAAFGGGVSAGYPATYYVALFTTTPGTDGTGGVEASYTDYDRFAVSNDPTEFPNAVGSPPVKSNANEWDFGVAGSGPTGVVSFGFYDDPSSTSAADLVAVVDISGAPITINNGADVKVPGSGIDLSGCV